MSRVLFFATILVTCVSGVARGEVDFSRDVLPLLSDRCFACHGPDANRREAGLRLDTFEGATSESDGGVRAIVPGDPEASALIERIHATDSSEIMPPPSLNRPLSDADRELLRTWIAEGARYERHWAFATPVAKPLPNVRDHHWSRGSLDTFVLAGLEQAGLSPNGEADRATLLRRASLALTGLPPSLEEIEFFERDESPDAYERQIDRLLASPRHGERMALDWLDLARFADTLGYQVDAECFVWPWRDWVIRAYNEDLSYDQFLTWQIAGDLLPDATQDQRLATLFNRLHRQTNEGGSIEQEFRQEYVSDRVHTFGTVFLGLTLECSRCHDHKYDPLPMTDYYSLCATFGRIDECGLYPYGVSTSASEPSMRLMEPEQEAEAKRRQEAFESADERWKAIRQTREEAFRQWLDSVAVVDPPVADERFTMDAVVDGRLPNAIADKAAGSISGGELAAVPGVVDGGMQFDGDTVLTLDGVGGITRHEPLSVSIQLFSPERKDRAVLMHTGPALYALASDASGYELLLEDGKLRWSCIFLWPGCCASIETTEDFPVGRWVDVTVTYDGSSRASGLKIYLDGRPASTVVLHDHLDKNIVTERMRLGARPRDDRGFAGGMMDELRIYRQTLSALEVAAGANGIEGDLLQRARAEAEDALELLRAHYLDKVDPEVKAAREARDVALRQLEDEYLHRMPLIMTMKESPNPRPFYVLRRGDYASPDREQPVGPGALDTILEYDRDQVTDRLGLARWMTDPRHPLVGRVAVNRLWMQVFGTGIVVTQENFGTQGDPPSHPDLLDRLASEFVAEGWSGKRMLRRLVTSATFRQSSAASTEKRERDPLNRLWSRGPSQRLSGEAIRDLGLAAAGTLVERVGGPSVKPWQPPGIWSESGASGGEYVPDQGAAAHRRSLYTYRKRTAPPPALLTLDAGSREVCQPRRLATNTPLQPLIFLNDRGFFEGARDLAERARRETQGTNETAIERAFRLLTARWPEPVEAESLQELFEEQRAHYATDQAGAIAVCGVEDAEWAALTIVCSTLMASDAAITQR